MANIHSKSIPQSDIDLALQKFEEGYSILRPYMLQLNQSERQTILKMGDKSLALVEKTIELARANPEFCPSYFSLDEINIDFADAVNLRTLHNRVQQIERDLEDTMMIAGGEALTQSLSFYNSVKQAVRDKASGAMAIFDELKKRFIIGRRQKTEN